MAEGDGLASQAPGPDEGLLSLRAVRHHPAAFSRVRGGPYNIAARRSDEWQTALVSASPTLAPRQAAAGDFLLMKGRKWPGEADQGGQHHTPHLSL